MENNWFVIAAFPSIAHNIATLEAVPAPKLYVSEVTETSLLRNQVQKPQCMWRLRFKSLSPK